jgi:nitrogen fixation protein NifX
MSGHTEGLPRPTALRIGLAARVLPETTPDRLLRVLISALEMPITDEKLATLSVKTLKTALDGEFSEVDHAFLKQAVRFLKGEQGIEQDIGLPRPLPYRQGDLPDSIRVAFASNTGERLDGHFASCQRFLIYQVNADTARLIAVRPVEEPVLQPGQDKSAHRVDLIRDCHILYIVSIGGPPAARVVNAGIHPIKNPESIAISELLPRLQAVLAGTPPPWLAKIIGRLPQDSARAEAVSSSLEGEP